MLKAVFYILIMSLLVMTGRKSLNANSLLDLDEISSKSLNSIINEYNVIYLDSEIIDNELFFLPDGVYAYSLSQKYNEINDNFIKEIIDGNLFVIFNWVKTLTFRKKGNELYINLSENEFHNSNISQKLIALQDKWISYLTTFIDNSVEINYEQFICIKFEIMNDNTLLIYNIDGIEIKNNSSISNKMLTLLDISRYKLLYLDNCVFLGIVNTEKDGYFEYYIYTSMKDIEERGLNEVFKKSNENIRTNLKPFVKYFFE